MQRFFFVLAVLLCALAAAAPVLAQDSRATVRLDGRALFRIGGAKGEEAAPRARQIERRLNAVLENPQAIASARIEANSTPPEQRLISVAGRPIVTVTANDAADNTLSTQALALQWAQAIDTALQRSGSRRLSAWGRFSSEVQASVQTSFARLLESAITVVPRALAALLVIAFFWGLAAFVRWLMRQIFCRITSDQTLENLIKQVAYYTVWLLGLIVAANAFGAEPQALATGLGLTSLALGFALKDILSNFVSGLLILTMRPFHLGDQIIIGETEGSVERIELRATQIRTYDGRAVLVPNAEVFTSRVTNNTAAPIRRGGVRLFLGYDADLRRAAEVVREAAQKSEGVLADPPASVRVRELGPSDILLEARFWTDSRRSDYVATASVARQEIRDALVAAGIPLPDPNARFLAPRQPEQWQMALAGEAEIVQKEKSRDR